MYVFVKNYYFNFIEVIKRDVVTCSKLKVTGFLAVTVGGLRAIIDWT